MGFLSEKMGHNADEPEIVPPSYSGEQTSSTSTPFRSSFSSLSLHMTDRVRLLDFPPEIEQLIKSTLSRSWIHGIQDQRDYHGSTEIKLKGNPWRGHSDEAVYARQLMQKLLESLFNAGYILSLNTDISKKQMDLDTLIFRQQDPVPTPCQWLTIAFSKTDRLRFFDAPQEVIGDMMVAIGPHVQSHQGHRIAGVYEMKLRGYPWAASGGETVAVRKLILRLLTVLERHGFTVYASIDQKTGPCGDTQRTETDTWFCTRPTDWSSGLPVYHA